MGHEKPHCTGETVCIALVALCVIALYAGIIIYAAIDYSRDSPVPVPEPVPDIVLASMDFTVLNITETCLSATWDLSIRIPGDLSRFYICLQGDLQASFLYKNVTLATSSPQKYNNLQYGWPQLLKVSALVSNKNISGLIGKDIMEDIKDKKEVRFGSRFFLTDCRENTTGIMSYACDGITLRFEPGPDMKATVFGNHPNCINF